MKLIAIVLLSLVLSACADAQEPEPEPPCFGATAYQKCEIWEMLVESGQLQYVEPRGDWRTLLYERQHCRGAACTNRVIAGERQREGERVTIWRNPQN